MFTTHAAVMYILMTISPDGHLTQHRYDTFSACDQVRRTEIQLAREAGVKLTAKCIPRQVTVDGPFYPEDRPVTKHPHPEHEHATDEQH